MLPAPCRPNLQTLFNRCKICGFNNVEKKSEKGSAMRAKKPKNDLFLVEKGEILNINKSSQVICQNDALDVKCPKKLGRFLKNHPQPTLTLSMRDSFI